MASDGGQDWLGLLYLFLAGLVSVGVDIVRRLTSKIGAPPEDHPHRRWDDDDRESHHHHRKEDEE